MKKFRKPFLSIGLVLALLLGCLPTQAFAMGPDKDPVITGSYQFTSNELSNIQETDRDKDVYLDYSVKL